MWYGIPDGKTSYDGAQTHAFVGGGSIMNLDTHEGKMYRGTVAYKSAQKIGAARGPHSRKRRMVNFNQIIPNHKKNISYESYLMNRPVIRRYSNAQMGYPGDDGPPDAAIIAAGEAGSPVDQMAGTEHQATDQMMTANQ